MSQVCCGVVKSLCRGGGGPTGSGAGEAILVASFMAGLRVVYGGVVFLSAFLLFADLAQHPVEEKFARQELDDNVGMLEDVGNQPQPDMKAGGAGPMDAEDLGVSGERGADPKKNLRCPAAVIPHKADIPTCHQDEPSQNLEQRGPQGTHTA